MVVLTGTSSVLNPLNLPAPLSSPGAKSRVIRTSSSNIHRTVGSLHRRESHSLTKRSVTLQIWERCTAYEGLQLEMGLSSGLVLFSVQPEQDTDANNTLNCGVTWT